MHGSRHVPASCHRAVHVSDQTDVKSVTSNNLNSHDWLWLLCCYAAAVKKFDVGRVEDLAEYFWPTDRLWERSCGLWVFTCTLRGYIDIFHNGWNKLHTYCVLKTNLSNCLVDSIRGVVDWIKSNQIWIKSVYRESNLTRRSHVSVANEI